MNGSATTKNDFMSSTQYPLFSFSAAPPIKQELTLYATEDFNSTASSSPVMQTSSQMLLSSPSSSASPYSTNSSTFDEVFDLFGSTPVLQHHHHQHRQSISSSQAYLYPLQPQPVQPNVYFYCSQPPQPQESSSHTIALPTPPKAAPAAAEAQAQGAPRQAPSTDIRPYPCHMCTRAFARKHDLQRHIRVHTGAKPYSCLCCKKAFARTDALKRHLRMEEACRTSPEVQAMKGAGKRRYKNL
ncbi:hypothetical protein EC973_002378 [Apophysomyces ossiformis]|uniref:C2H2-type domain-containing protein n=1 Tax=Apophysomyces ossiformis TaxID=679940 RepID=A0A8H7BKR1_9FUNG|nr:hypothetical protein EC973_002378 [Apophysomyces ossiformis]